MIIAHDLGTTGNKASLHDDEGKLIEHCTISFPAHFAAGGIAEQDPMDWWNAVGTASKALLANGKVNPREVTGVAISGQMMGALLLDNDYAPVRPAIIWADYRSNAQSKELLAQIPMSQAYAELGHQLNPTYSITKAMWVRDNEPAIWQRVRHICNAKDFINYRLTGRLATDPSDASSTNAFNQVTGTWSSRILKAARIDPALMPEIIPSTSIIGELTNEAAEHTGLAVGTPVVTGGGDGPMAAVGAGIISPEDGAYICMGSSSWVSVSSNTPLHDPLMRSMTFNHVVPGKFVPTATMQAGGASLQWITDALLPEKSPDRYKVLLSEAANKSASSEGLFFLPHIMGERSPYWNPDASGAFLGLAKHHDRGFLVRAVLEGVAFNLLTCIQAFAENGRSIKQVDVIGGGAGSALWLQIFADVWGIEVRSRSIVEEANSLGAAVTALVGLGKRSFELSKSLSKITANYQPSSESHNAYLSQHKIFLAGYQALEPWFPTRVSKR
jgi:xylulokinase